MKLDITIPTNLDEISLGTYQTFLGVTEKTNDEEFLCEKMVQIFCNIELKDVAEIRWTDVQYIINKINTAFKQKPKFKKTFKINKVEFGFIPDLENISFGEFVDLQNNLEKIEDFHKAMAVMYRPILDKKGEKYEIEQYFSAHNYAEVMQHVSIDIALAAKVFFCDLLKELLNSTLLYLKTEVMTNPKMKTALAQELNLEKTGDGIKVFMESQMEILRNLTESQPCPYESALHGLLLKNKKEVLKIVRCKEN